MRRVSISVGIFVLAILSFLGPITRAKAADAPLKPGEFTVELNGVKQWYKVSGTGPLCLMPSPPWGVSSDLYFRTLKPMEKLFTIVYLDSRGCGRSGQARASTQYRWDNLIADLDALRRHLKQDKVWLMGHSAAGVSVLQYACRHPERVSGLVLLDTYAVVDDRMGADMMARLDQRKGQPWYRAAMKAMHTHPKSSAELTARTLHMLPLYLSDPKTAPHYQKVLATTTFSIAAFEGRIVSKRIPFDLIGQLHKITAPVLIVVGSDDLFSSPLSAVRMHLHLPHSKLLVIEHAGHFPWLEQPEVFRVWVPKFLAALGMVGK